MYCSPDIYCPSDQIVEVKWAGHVSRMREKGNTVHVLVVETLRDHSENISVNGTIILK